MKVALIDLGTNSARLFIYRMRADGQWLKLRKLKEMVRLGDDLFRSNSLSEEACERTVKVFELFAAQMNLDEPDLVVAYATSAMRTATNADVLRTAIYERTGILIETISGNREAQLIAKGVCAVIELPEEPLIFVDIGGGSTEISIAHGSEIQESKSLELGAGRNQQLFLKTVPPVTNKKGCGVEALRRHVQETLVSQFPDPLEVKLAIGTSGSIRAINRIYSKRTHSNYEFKQSVLAQLIEEMTPLTREELLQLPKLEEKRVDLILAGSVILDECLSYFGAKRVYVSSVALKDGMLAEIKDQI
ncbi:MAG: hypothetical protein KDD62_00650 [Bdellovibrionales bacterium]|nr:hypothetical protein [Bdellovibrionales bacterium]